MNEYMYFIYIYICIHICIYIIYDLYKYQHRRVSFKSVTALQTVTKRELKPRTHFQKTGGCFEKFC